MAQEPISRARVSTDSNTVEVSWGSGRRFVQIGVREPAADLNIGEREFSHYSTLTRQELRRLVRVLRRAERLAFAG